MGGCAPLRVIIERLGQRYDSAGVSCAMRADIGVKYVNMASKEGSKASI